MDESSTTPPNNPTDEAAASTNPAESAGTENQTGSENQQPDPSKSTETPSDDGDKSTETEENKGGSDDAPASTFDDDLDDWAEKRKMPKAETDEQKQAYQDLRNSQREYTREQQAKKDAKALSDSINKAKEDDALNTDEEDDELDETEKTVKQLKERADREEAARLQSEFWQENKVSEDEGKQIATIFQTKMDTLLKDSNLSDEQKRQAFAYWSSPAALPDLLTQAKANIITSTKSFTDEEVARQERERIAHESQANSPGRNAKQTTTSGKTPEEQRLERFSNW